MPVAFSNHLSASPLPFPPPPLPPPSNRIAKLREFSDSDWLPRRRIQHRIATLESEALCDSTCVHIHDICVNSAMLSELIFGHYY